MSDNKTYSAEEIRLYLEGKMAAADMHALEMAALNDPFLADAIEGLQQYPDKKQFFTESAQLRERLNERLKKKNRLAVIPLLWKVAAVLFIVVSGVALIIYLGEPIKQNEKALTKAEKQKQKESVRPQTADSTPAAAATQNKFEEAIVSSKPLARKKNIPPLPVTAAEVEAQDTSADREVITAYGLTKADSVRTESQPSQQNAAKALAGRAAGISVENRHRTVVSDNKNPSDIIPDGGWNAFEAYIDSCKKTSPQLTQRGTQKIIFRIDEAGRPARISMRNSLSPAHDAAITKWLNDGPVWNVSEGKKRKVALTITF